MCGGQVPFEPKWPDKMTQMLKDEGVLLEDDPVYVHQGFGKLFSGIVPQICYKFRMILHKWLIEDEEAQAELGSDTISETEMIITGHR